MVSLIANRAVHALIFDRSLYKSHRGRCRSLAYSFDVLAGKCSERMTDTDIVSGHLSDQHPEVCCLRGSSGNHDAASEMFGKSALADFVEHCLDYLLHACCNDLREVLHGNLLRLFCCIALDVQHLFAEALELVRHACAECELDVLGQSFADLQLGLDVIGYVPSAERYRSVVAHDVAMVDGNRCAAASEVDQSHTVLHLDVGEHGFGCGLGCEVFLL